MSFGMQCQQNGWPGFPSLPSLLLLLLLLMRGFRGWVQRLPWPGLGRRGGEPFPVDARLLRDGRIGITAGWGGGL